MKKLLYISFLCLSIACKKSSDPIPDLTSKLVGTYVDIQTDNTFGFKYITTTKWTVSRVDNDEIKIDHVAVTEIEAPAGYPGTFNPTKPVVSVIDGIKIEKDDRFAFDRLVEWTSDSDVFKTTVIVDAVLAGRDLDVKINETTDGATTDDRVIMKRQ
ncbi:hypothetical protein [Dyadobacter chenhuakuii]|uniref:Uncharacterized protein n=1 Tax=Dyadobacter chenhuakuii TaxID=2909339 RepID=A0A9X1TSS3_9BACT|nr:hypothetical protein [Dyadobacter chenhuakuii]MCF2498355.1 hypothetical protein [Dyadobacter chenhuakuii]